MGRPLSINDQPCLGHAQVLDYHLPHVALEEIISLEVIAISTAMTTDRIALVNFSSSLNSLGVEGQG